MFRHNVMCRSNSIRISRSVFYATDETETLWENSLRKKQIKYEWFGIGLNCDSCISSVKSFLYEYCAAVFDWLAPPVAAAVSL